MIKWDVNAKNATNALKLHRLETGHIIKIHDVHTGYCHNCKSHFWTDSSLADIDKAADYVENLDKDEGGAISK